MKIYLIRHGQTTGDLEARYGGWYDDHLTKKGINQSIELSKRLNRKGIQKIYHSFLIRAAETAFILGESLNVPLVSVPAIREQNRYGILTGMKKSDAKKQYPNDVLELAKGINGNATGSEPYSDFCRRILLGMKRILKECSEKHYTVIAIISHGGPIKCIVREMAKAGELEEMADCGFLVLDYKRGKLKVVSTSDLYHS